MEPIYIYIDFTRPGPNAPWSPLAPVIRAVERTEYSHVLLRWTSPISGTECIYEASLAGVGFRGPISARGRYEVVRRYRFAITYAEYRLLLRFCQMQAGIQYGTRQLLGILLARVFGLSRNPLARGTSSQVCSEMVGYFIETVLGYDIPVDLDLAGPREIDEFLASIQKPIIDNTR